MSEPLLKVENLKQHFPVSRQFTVKAVNGVSFEAVSYTHLLEKARAYGLEKLAGETGLGLPTLQDILAELQKPGRDPREDLPQPILRTDVLDIKDLKPGMELMGTVRNVIDFGAFVEIGVHQDGLVHISRMANRFIKHPSEAAKVGDRVKVWVVEVDEKKKRIALTMIPPVQK